MGFIQRTSFLAFFALGAVAYTSDPLPEPSQVPLITAVPIPGITDEAPVTDIPSFTDGPVFTDVPYFTDVPTISEEPTISDEPIFTDEPVITDEPTVTYAPAVSPFPSNPITAGSPAPSPVHPGCGKGCATQSPGAIPSPGLKDVCFEKKQTCCYKHSVCSTRRKMYNSAKR